MSAPVRIYQQLEAQIKHCTLRGAARELTAMGLSAAQPESTAIGRAASAARCTNNVAVDSRCPRTTIWWHDRVA